MASARHSYVRFFPSDWMAGTARMARLHKSVYFDICVYNWDMNAPVPPGELALMLADIPEWAAIVDALLAAGKLVRCEDGCVANPRAMAEARHSFEVWKRKSEGGQKGAEKRWGDGIPNGSANSTPNGMGMGMLMQNQNQNQNHIPTVPRETRAPGAKKGSRLPADWTPSEAEIAFAKEKGLEGKAIAETAFEFRDYWAAQPGQKGVKLDWPATWRNWVRREVKAGARAVKFTSATGYAYRGTIDEVIRQAGRRHDQDVLAKAREAKKRQDSEDPKAIGSIIHGITERMAGNG